MKKTLLATAIAGALGASAAAQAATVYNQDGTQLDIYGNVQIAYRSVDEGPDREDELFDNGSTFGIAGQHIINPGLTGYFKAEWEYTADQAKGTGRGLNNGDQAYMGLQGNFGDVRLGSWDPLIDDWIQDPITNNEYFDASDSNSRFQQFGADDREGDKLQYMSPSFGGLQFAIGAQYKGDADTLAQGSETDFYESDNAGNPVLAGSIDTTVDIERDDDASFFGGVKYTMGAFSIAAVYDNLAIYDGTVTSVGDAAVGGGAAVGDSYEAGDQYGITGEYTMDALRVALKVERYDGDDDIDVNFYGLGARYGYGFGDVYGAYQYVDVGGGSFRSELGDFISGENEDGDETYNEVVLGATYNISSSLYTFVEGAWYDREDDAGDGVAVGAVYAF